MAICLKSENEKVLSAGLAIKLESKHCIAPNQRCLGGIYERRFFEYPVYRTIPP